MKRLLTGLVILSLLFLLIPSSLAENAPIIRDEADLLSDADEGALYAAMKPVCAYCIPVFWTTDAADSTPTQKKAQEFLKRQVGNEEGTIFVIDMANRQIAIWSTEGISRTITTDVAYAITDETYIHATRGDYLTCAAETFAAIAEKLKMDSSKGESASTLDEQSLYMTGMRAECADAMDLISRISRTGGTDNVSLLAEARSHVYAFQILNALYFYETGRIAVDNELIDDTLEMIDGYISRLLTGMDSAETLTALLNRLRELQQTVGAASGR